MPILEFNSRKISYDDYGSGPIILLLHGTPGNSKSWEPAGKQLADRFRVIAPDLPGYGETTPQSLEDPPEVKYASLLIERLIHKIGVPSIIAGHSYGGVVALNLAIRKDMALQKLVLFEPVALSILPLAGELEIFRKAGFVFEDYIDSFKKGNHQAVQKMIDFWFGDGAFDRLPSKFVSYLIDETPFNIRDVQATFRECYSSDTLQKIHFPVEVIVGDNSPETTLRIGKAIVNLVRIGKLLKMKDANHAMINTHMDAVVRIIEGIHSDFVKEPLY